MADRKKAPSEQSLHKKMVEGDVVRGGVKGGVVGTALGAGLRHLGHAGKNAPLYGAAAGTALGAISGYHRGKERQLRDTVQQERQHMRTKARTKKAYNEVLWDAFSDEVEKRAFAGLATRLGANIMRGGTALAGAISPEAAKTVTGWIGSGTKALGGKLTGTRRLARATGYTAMGGTGLLAGGALLGRATAPSSPGY